MSTTYYLLRVKTSAQGDGAYLGIDGNAAPTLVPVPVNARRFGSIDEAEQTSKEMGADFGGFEIEVRNTVD